MNDRRLTGLLFCLPWFIGFGVFMLYPMLAALYYSLSDYSVLLPPVFIGLENYIELSTDEIFWKSLSNTLVYATGAVCLSMLTSLTFCSIVGFEAWPSTARFSSSRRSCP